jgi:hypothetical protein
VPAPAKTGLARHLEGWQVGALMVFIVASISAVMVPRSADPTGLPPADLGLELLASARAESARAHAAAVAFELPNSARLVAARLRALGAIEAEDDDSRIDDARQLVLESVRQALHERPEAVVAVRDREAVRFRELYLQRMRGAEPADELAEVGGSILRQFDENGWLSRSSEIDATTETLLEGFYKRRFARVVDTKHPALSPSQTEERVLLGFLLLHPPKPRIEEGNVGGDGTGPYQLRRIDELVLLEPSYPAAYAKGIVFFHMGHFEASASAFDAFLRQGNADGIGHGDGPYRLRAVNYLKSAVEHTEGM